MNLFHAGLPAKRRGRATAVAGVAMLIIAGLTSSGTAFAAETPSSVAAASAHGTGGATLLGSVQPGGKTPSSAPKKAEAAEQGPARSAVAADYRQYTTWYGPITIQSYQWWEAWVYCPSGMKATSGGERNSSAGGVTLHDTYPLPDGSGWKVKVTNTASSAETFTVYAVCFSGLSNYVHAFDKVSVPGGGYAGAVANCPPAQQVVGGGGFSDTFYNGVSSGTFQNAWDFGMYNDESVPRTVTAQAVCANGVNNYQLVWGTVDATVAPGQTATEAVYCPGSTWVVGGGSFFAGGKLRVTDSYPEGQGWRVYALNTGTSDAYFYGKVLCGN